MREWTVTSCSPAETQKLGRLLGEALQRPTVVWLSGELGAGKTCFTQGLARGLSVSENEPVTSPSYTLMNHYRGRLDLYHFDLYRLSHPDELVDLGFDDYVHGSGVAAVEWADRFPGMETEGVQVQIAHRDAGSRTVVFRVHGVAGEGVLAHLTRRWREEGESV